jgi:hypothetical protein
MILTPLHGKRSRKWDSGVTMSTYQEIFNERVKALFEDKIKKLPYSLNGIETNVTKRWEEGIPHHPESKQIIESLATWDFVHGGEYLCVKIGGDGDNGEHMMYLLDIYFEARDKYNKDNK